MPWSCHTSSLQTHRLGRQVPLQVFLLLWGADWFCSWVRNELRKQTHTKLWVFRHWGGRIRKHDFIQTTNCWYWEYWPLARTGDISKFQSLIQYAIIDYPIYIDTVLTVGDTQKPLHSKNLWFSGRNSKKTITICYNGIRAGIKAYPRYGLSGEENHENRNCICRTSSTPLSFCVAVIRLEGWYQL